MSFKTIPAIALSEREKSINLALLKIKGEVAEWLNAHAWKACLRQRNGGSNPPLSAKIIKAVHFCRAFFVNETKACFMVKWEKKLGAATRHGFN